MGRLNYQQALDAGKTPSEIRSFIAAEQAKGINVEVFNRPGANVPEMTAPGRFHVDFPGGPEEGIEANPLLNPLELMVGGGSLRHVPAATGRLVQGAGAAMGRVGPAVGRMAGGAATEMALEMLPAPARIAIRAALAGARRTAGKEVVEEAEKVGGKAAGKVAARIKPAPKAAAAKPSAKAAEPKAKPYRPPKKKPASAPKTPVEKRIAMQAPEEVAAAREAGRAQMTAGGKDLRRLPGVGQTRVAPSQAMRGASGPALERRAAARAKAVARPALAEPEMPGDFTDVLEQSLALEARMTAEGLTPVEKILIRGMMLRQGSGMP